MRVIKVVLKLALGLSLGLVLAEVAFSVRDHGAFPHVNFYVEDATLGARLEPHATMRLQVAGNNPVTTTATNSLGFRTPEWPAPTKGEVLVVGDSQVFGLGVEENETFSTKLSEALGVPVLNAGVPTWGPREYTATVKDVLLRRPTVRTVVYVLNLSNDLFEADRPNAERHKVWDGWAVRTETAPDGHVTDFPFRRALMSKSHLVFGVRQLLHASEQAGGEVETEGSWRDIAAAGRGLTPVPSLEKVPAALAERETLDAKLDAVNAQLNALLRRRILSSSYAEPLKPLLKGGDPRDIVSRPYAEVARRVDVTAQHLFFAAVAATRNEALLESLAEQKADADLKQLLLERKALRRQFDAAFPSGQSESPLERVLLETRAACDAAGASLVVVVLPLDVMVSADEWKKYVGVTAIDMSATRVLREDLVARVQRLGAVAFDATDALAAAEPGAFLDADLHLTPKGHAALARALVEPVTRRPRAEPWVLAPGRSPPPTVDELGRVDALEVAGADEAGCVIKRVREWVLLRCGNRKVEREPSDLIPFDDFGEERAISAAVVWGGHGDALVLGVRAAVTVSLPIVEGDEAELTFWWDATQQTVRLAWPKGGTWKMSFGKPEPRGDAEPPALATEGWAFLYWEHLKTGRPHSDFVDAYRVRAEPFMKRGENPPPPEAPACLEGEVKGGARLRCAWPCGADRPCAKGHCEPWPSGSFCAIP